MNVFGDIVISFFFSFLFFWFDPAYLSTNLTCERSQTCSSIMENTTDIAYGVMSAQ